MKKYIDAERLKKSIGYYMEGAHAALNPTDGDADYYKGKIDACEDMQELITSLQQEQQVNMIQWTGNNLKEVIDFTGKSPRFEEWFKSWEEFETYVHQHNDILKLFCEDGSHYEVPKGAWIVKTPDGYNLPSVAKYIHKERPEMDLEEYIENEVKHYGLSLYEASYGTFSASQIDRIIRNAFEFGLNARKEE